LENEIEEEVPIQKKEKEDLSCTLFVRNISFETTEFEFKEFCNGLGEIEYAKLCKRGEIGGHKGIGFVKLKEKEVVKKILEYCKNLREGEPNPNFLDLEL